MRKLAIAVFSFASAIFLALYLTGTENCIVFAGIFVIAGLFALLLKGKARTAAMISLFAAAIGMLWVFAYSKICYEPAASLDGKRAVIEAEVTDFPNLTDYGSKVTVKFNAENGRRLKAELYIFDESGDGFIPGDEITAEVKLSLTDRRYISDGAFLSAFCNGKAEKTDSGEDEKLLYLHRYGAKAFSEMIDSVFKPQVSPFITAMLTGDKTALNEDNVTSSSLRTSGISHIVAVSGMHLAFLVGFVLTTVRRRRLASFIAMPVIVLFAAMVGFPPSIVRAAIMQILLLIAPLAYREEDGVTSLAFALGFILAVNPYAALSVSLQLSFAAVLGMILITERLSGSIYSRLRPRKKIKNKLLRKAAGFVVDTLCASVGALVFTVPLSAMHFGSVSLAAPITNILTLWAVSLCFVLSFVACILGFIWLPLGSAAAFLASVPAKYVLWIAKSISKMSIATISSGNIPVMVAVILVYIIIVLYVLMKAEPKRLILPGSFAAVFLCITLIVSSAAPHSSKMKVTAIDVGQGQSIAVTSGEYTVLVDCGSSSGEDAGRIAASFLAGECVGRVDVLVFTHLHEDHANGFKNLSETVDIGAILMPEPLEGEEGLREEIIALAEYRQIDVKYVTEDISVDLGNMRMDIFAPLGYENENENGLTVLLSQTDFEFLVTGDVPEYVEERLVTEKNVPDIELLVIGHHGSKYSTSDNLLDTVRPEAAIISVGENTYGHPTPEVLERLLSRGISVYRTDTEGNITIVSE